MQEEYAQVYSELYRRHWWWRVRESIVLQQIERLGFEHPIDVLDVGCGNGLFLPDLARLGRVSGIEVDTRLLGDDTPFRERIFSEPLGSEIYAGLQFDLITALDVIEHIEDDARAVRDMAAMLAPGGKLIVTVPAFMVLWEEHDRLNRHYRRYTASGLRNLLQPHGRLVRMRYLYRSLFLPKLLLRLIGSLGIGGVQQHRIPPAWINRAASTFFRFEHRALSWLPLPFGTSVMAILEKRR